MKFKDLNDFNALTCYAVVNENISAWRECLDGIEVDNAASICSGGEVAFFGILPSVKERLSLIDHSYASMYFAIGKYNMIEKFGASKTHELFTGFNWYKGGRRWSPSVDNYVQDPEAESSISSNDLRKAFDKANKRLPTAKHGVNGYWPPASLRVTWQNIDVQEVAEFRRNRTKIQFLHGDVGDLADIRPYDLVYLSNALDYKGRNGSGHDAFRLNEVVKPGGFVLYCFQGINAYPIGPRKVPAGWEIIKEITPDRRNYGLHWTHRVCQVPA